MLDAEHRVLSSSLPPETVRVTAQSLFGDTSIYLIRYHAVRFLPFCVFFYHGSSNKHDFALLIRFSHLQQFSKSKNALRVAKLIYLPLSALRANSSSVFQLQQTVPMHLMVRNAGTAHLPSQKKRGITCPVKRYTSRCLGKHRVIALRGKPRYRDDSKSENENGSFPALREDPYLSLLSSSTACALVPPETATSKSLL